MDSEPTNGKLFCVNQQHDVSKRITVENRWSWSCNSIDVLPAAQSTASTYSKDNQPASSAAWFCWAVLESVVHTPGQLGWSCVQLVAGWTPEQHRDVMQCSPPVPSVLLDSIPSATQKRQLSVFVSSLFKSSQVTPGYSVCPRKPSGNYRSTFVDRLDALHVTQTIPSTHWKNLSKKKQTDVNWILWQQNTSTQRYVNTEYNKHRHTHRHTEHQAPPTDTSSSFLAVDSAYTAIRVFRLLVGRSGTRYQTKSESFDSFRQFLKTILFSLY